MKLKLNIELDLTELVEAIGKADKLEDVDFFNHVSKIVEAKIIVRDALDQIQRLETDIKGLIDSKATATIGNDWSAIVGDHFKITKQHTGSVFELVSEDVADDFVTIKTAPNTIAINQYRITHEGKLPKGVTVNEDRNTQIWIKLK
jgi:hypothetical protein